MPRLPLLVPLFLAVGGGVVYHLAAKSVPRNIDPPVVLIGAYTTALCASVLAYLLLPAGGSGAGPIRPWHLSVAGVGLGAVMIELGYVLTYRAAWPISVASVVINGIVAVLLIPVGVELFSERLSAARGLGIVLCLIGIMLLRR